MSVEDWFQLFFVLTLAVAAGVALISRVPPLLHTPLMSGSNAISGITVVGALLLAGRLGNPELAKIMAAVAVLFASINVVGGFLVTHRMLVMFKKKK